MERMYEVCGRTLVCDGPIDFWGVLRCHPGWGHPLLPGWAGSAVAPLLLRCTSSWMPRELPSLVPGYLRACGRRHLISSDLRENAPLAGGRQMQWPGGHLSNRERTTFAIHFEGDRKCCILTSLQQKATPPPTALLRSQAGALSRLSQEKFCKGLRVSTFAKVGVVESNFSGNLRRVTVTPTPTLYQGCHPKFAQSEFHGPSQEKHWIVSQGRQTHFLTRLLHTPISASVQCHDRCP